MAVCSGFALTPRAWQGGGPAWLVLEGEAWPKPRKCLPSSHTSRGRPRALESREEGPGPRAHAARPTPRGPRLHSHPAHGTGTRPLPLGAACPRVGGPHCTPPPTDRQRTEGPGPSVTALSAGEGQVRGRSCLPPRGDALSGGTQSARVRGVCVVCVHTCLCAFLLLAWLHAHWADEEMRPATFPEPYEMLTRQQQPRDPNPSLSPASGLQLRHTGVT